MMGAYVYYKGKNYQSKINLLRCILGICKYWLRKYSKYIEIYFSEIFQRRDINYNLLISLMQSF